MLQGQGDFGTNFRGRQRPNDIRLAHRDRDAVDVSDASARAGADALAGRHYAGQVQGIRGRDDERDCNGSTAPDLSQPFDRTGQRELLAGHAGDEASSPNLPARFEAPVNTRQVAPRGDERLASKHATEHDAIAPQQGPRLCFDCVGCAGWTGRWRNLAPPPGKGCASVVAGQTAVSRPDQRA